MIGLFEKYKIGEINHMGKYLAAFVFCGNRFVERNCFSENETSCRIGCDLES